MGNDITVPPPAKKRVGRPLGAKKRVDAIRKQAVDGYSPAQIAKIKRVILEMIDQRQATNLTEAANKLGLSKLMLHRWRRADKEWTQALLLADELLADEIELALADPANCRNVPFVTSMVFRLKALRPRYRDNYKPKEEDNRALKLLEELKEIGRKTAIEPRESDTEADASEELNDAVVGLELSDTENQMEDHAQETPASGEPEAKPGGESSKNILSSQ